MSEPATQRADPLAHLPGLLAELGVPLDAVFEGSGIRAEDLTQGRFVPFAAMLTVAENAAAVSGREDLGLLLGFRHSADVLGPVAEVLRTAATLGEALSDLAALQTSNSSGAAAYLHRQRDQIFFGYGVHDPSLPTSPVLQDIVIAVGFRFVTELTRGAVRPREYLSMRPPPRDPHRWAALGAPLRFGAAETGFYLSPADFACPLPTADRGRHDAALRGMLAAPPLVPAEWTQRTRHALRCLLLEGRSAMPEVSLSLGIGERTLRRALSREGTTFEELRGGVRLAIAQDLLSMSELSIGDLALTLDFATPSAFIHAFRRWTGESPAAWRKERQRGRLSAR
jgi:AraC-like DNA-binding protein